MDKRFQVFISSTYQDLQDARQEVSQALLKTDCFPAGMELFPAVDEEQFEFIKQVIEQSDYYILISAGRYGSIHPQKGMSYTELEYNYAVEVGKPVIRLLHRDPFNLLPGSYIEQNDAARAKLEQFREKVTKSALVDFWDAPAELGQKVVFGLMDARKRKPATGWVRADRRSSDEAEIEIAELRREVAELKLQAEQMARREPDFAQRLENMRQVCTVDLGVRGTSELSVQVEPRSFRVNLQDICEAMCFAMLELKREHVIVDRILYYIWQEKVNLNSEVYLADSRQDQIFKGALAFLEANDFAVSHPFVDEKNYVRGLEWQLTTAARRWIRGRQVFSKFGD